MERRLEETAEQQIDILVSLQPTYCHNLQSALKTIIKASLAGHGGEKVYADFLAEQKALIPMNFDLELLQRYLQRENVDRVLISIMDVETFDTPILSELISTFHSWSDRIPFLLLVGVSTTTELFETRFSRSSISLLDAHVLETNIPTGGDPLFHLYEKIQLDRDTEVFLGSSVVNVLADLADDQATTPDSLTRTMKYAYMSHFFANPSSALSSRSNKIPWDPALYKAIRTLPSFKHHCEMLAKGDKSARQKARSLLSSDKDLQTEAKDAVQSGQAFMSSCLNAISTLRYFYHKILNLDKYTSWESQSHLLASLPNLAQSTLFKAIEEAIRFRPSPPTLPDLLDNIAGGLSDFQEYCSSENTDPDVQDVPALLRLYLTHRTTPPILSPLAPGVSPFRQFLAETYIISSKSPLSQTIHPRARFCIERALTSPADYLDCTCCNTENGADGAINKANLPPSSLLLLMLNEAGMVINVRDLWDAFQETWSRRRDEEPADDEADQGSGDAENENERQTLALFYRSLAELRYLGLIKQSKRKPGVECIQKTMWMGL